MTGPLAILIGPMAAGKTSVGRALASRLEVPFADLDALIVEADGRSIPEIFAARNKQLLWGQLEEEKADYAKAVENGGKASDCIACGQCVRACPQQLPVIDHLKDCAS